MSQESNGQRSEAGADAAGRGALEASLTNAASAKLRFCLNQTFPLLLPQQRSDERGIMFHCCYQLILNICIRQTDVALFGWCSAGTNQPECCSLLLLLLVYFLFLFPPKVLLASAAPRNMT